MNEEQRAVETYGVEAQLVVAIEELSELQKELCKYLRGYPCADHITEEMADVKIVLAELEYIFDNGTEIEGEMKIKLRRLAERLKADADDGNTD